MPRPYLISLASYTRGVERYLDSLSKLKDSVDLVYVDFRPHVPTHVLHDIKGIPLTTVMWVPVEDGYPGPIKRFGYIPENLDPNRWWIFTDTQDVIFQRPIPDLDSFGSDILVADEGEMFCESGTWAPIISILGMESLLPSRILNAGCFAMRGHLFKEFTKYLLGHEAIKLHSFSDQPILNLWVADKKALDCPELFLTIHKHYFAGRANRDKNWMFWRGDIFPVIVHGNGSGKEILPQ